MESIRSFAEKHPFWFVVALAILQPIIAVPFVAASKILGTEITPLRLIIPTVQSVFILWLVWALGWWRISGLTGPVRNTHLLIYPAMIHFLPVLLYGTVEIPAGWVLFYFLAVLATGVSEEGFARGIALPALLKFGKWGAVLIAAAIFSAGHLTNAAFEEFSLLEWVDKFGNTFAFAILYGALFLRTGSLLPLIFLHTFLDYIYITSGTAGPFIAEALNIRIHLGIAALNAAVGVYLIMSVTDEEISRIGRPSASRA